MGNPQLKKPLGAPNETRFKMWWRLVGSAIENAVKLAGSEINEKAYEKSELNPQHYSFKDLFIKREEDEDEETVFLADILKIIQAEWPQEFFARDMATKLNAKAFLSAESDASADDDMRILREFLLQGGPNRTELSSITVRDALKKYIDTPVRVDGRILVLRSRMDKHRKQSLYGVHEISEDSKNT
jgi:hypothetical protein